MTAAAVEVDAPELSSRDQHLAKWLELSAAADTELREAIAAELAEGLGDLEEVRARAAGALQEAYKALTGPEHDLSELDAEITGAESELATWQARLEQGDVATRVEARRWVAEYQDELAALAAKRDFSLAGLLPLRDAHAKAAAALSAAASAVDWREMNATPAGAYLDAGQDTAIYPLRWGLALENALRGENQAERHAAVEQMLHLCRVSGFRTEDYKDRLPDDAEQARKFWDSVYEGYQHSGTPTGREVAESVHADMERGAIRLHNNAMAGLDVNGEKLPPRPPKPAPPARDYMQPPERVSEMRARW